MTSEAENLVDMTRRAAKLALEHYELRAQMHAIMLEDLRDLPTAAQLDLARTYAHALRAQAAVIVALADDLDAETNALVEKVN